MTKTVELNIPFSAEDRLISMEQASEKAIADAITVLRQKLEEAADEIDRLNEECFTLAANQCHCGYGDGYGNHRCQYQDEIERLRAEVTHLKGRLGEGFY